MTVCGRCTDINITLKPVFSFQCATKSVILHLQWQEGDAAPLASPAITASSPLSMSANQGLPRMRAGSVLGNSALGRSTNLTGVSTLNRRTSLVTPAPGGGVSTLKSRLSVSGSRTPTTPLSPSPGPGGFPARFGRAAILTAPPRVVALVETPDVAVGAVDARKRRVVTATRFSSRAGADRRVRVTCSMSTLS